LEKQNERRNEMNENFDLIEKLKKELPIVFARKEIEHLLPGLISSKSLANLSSQGKGPPSYHHGRTVIYDRDVFLDWLSKRVR
jgi:hypothetical protein